MSSLLDNRRMRRGISIRRGPALQHGLVALLAVMLGLAGGAAVAFGPFWTGFVILAALALVYAMLLNTGVGLALVVLIATVLPFGTLPFKAVITPNFLELALLGLLVIWLLRLLTHPDDSFYLTALGLPLIGFIGVTLFSFILGSNGHPDSLTLHNYFKFILAVLFFFSVVNCLRTLDQARWAARLLIIGGAISALLGLALFFLPDRAALQILVSLGRVGYPTTGRVLRYVADDPSGVERAIGFAVDPNSYGGMLALIGALTISQTVAERPVIPRHWLYAMAGALALATFLTQSRGALGGLVVGTLYAATLRYRQLWRPIIGALAAALLLYFVFGIGGHFVTRVTEGIQFQDQANQMRLNEYQNALQIIQRYPVFGIGFANQGPDLDLGVGVSSIYLALAERVGLVGLFWFLGIIAAFFARGLPAMRSAFARHDDERGGLLLSLQAAIVAALAVGLLDHYFFNIEFSHMVALFWGSIGLALVAERTENQEPSTEYSSARLTLRVPVLRSRFSEDER